MRLIRPSAGRSGWRVDDGPKRGEVVERSGNVHSHKDGLPVGAAPGDRARFVVIEISSIALILRFGFGRVREFFQFR